MTRVASQVMLMLAAAAFASAATLREIAESVRLVERLEKTCTEYQGPQLPSLLAALGREATMLYEIDRCDVALDSILFAGALQRTQPQPLYGVQPGIAEAAVRPPSDDEREVIPIKDGKYDWMMVSVTNLSETELDLSGVKIVFEYDGTNVSTALPPDALVSMDLPEPARRLASMPKILPHGAAAFIVFLPRVNRWSSLTFTGDERLRLRVNNYAEMPEHFDRVQKARARAAKIKPKPPEPEPADVPEETKPGGPRFDLVGYIRNQIQPKRFGVQLVKPEHINQDTRLLVKRNEEIVAELKPIGSGTIAELVSGKEPEPGDAVVIEIVKEEKK